MQEAQRRLLNKTTEQEDKHMAYEIPYHEIGLRIRTLREANSYTRDAFAEKIRISAKFLYEIEVGKKGFSVEILYKISKALSVSTDYLVTGMDSSKLSGRTASSLEFFSPDQLSHVQDILKSVQELCTSTGNKVRERTDSKDETDNNAADDSETDNNE